MNDRSDPSRDREPIEISPEEARQDAPAPHAGRSGKTPATLIFLYGAGLILIALVLWVFLLADLF